MSERILKALMQLFAILSKVDYSSSHDSVTESIEIDEQRGVVESFLLNELNSNQVQNYLDIFDENIQLLNKVRVRKDGEIKKTSLNSVKILRICSDINKELTFIQKNIVLIRILEFVRINEFKSQQITDFVETVRSSFSIPEETFGLFHSFVHLSETTLLDDPRVAYVSSKSHSFDFSKTIAHPNLDEDIRILRFDVLNYMFVRYYGNDQLILNGQTVQKERVHVFSNGSSIRTNKSNPIYFSDVVAQFISDDAKEKVILKASDLSYKFNADKYGIHPFTMQAESGQLIGIMGSSGAGKSTLLNLLNGTLLPSSGKICLNGIELAENKNLEGKIGYISQDDLLIEELTVFQNLYYNAKLSFRSASELEVTRKVLMILNDLGLEHIRDLKIGNSLNKTISGGQRKRLNIALELIREPAVLFVDEPTSGLSSRDSENVMDLLKELSLKGKLIFVVIHQPSSEIFKMFDRLFLMDTGGYRIFDGKPSEATVYFKLHANHAGAEEFECSECGKVNPEEIFNIVEAKVVDELGNLSQVRKTSPLEWYQKFNKGFAVEDLECERTEFKTASEKPNKWTQFKAYFQRDLFSKVANRQYVWLNLLEAPVLAFILSYFLKYFGQNVDGVKVYSYFFNENIPQYIFISVVVSIFLGLAVAAEEIIKDKTLLKRERFLHLSRRSYLFSKISVLFSISAIQSLLFVLVGNTMLEFQGQFFSFWLLLFTTSCVANMLGLVVSSTFDSAKVVYIFIPFLIIPQLLFSGVIVKYDRLHPFLKSEKSVPWIGNLMFSRWAYEALAVELYVKNPMVEKTFEEEVRKEEAGWKKDYWYPEMKKNLTILESDQSTEMAKTWASQLVRAEIRKEENIWVDFKCENCNLGNDKFNTKAIQAYLSRLNEYYGRVYKKSSSKIESIKRSVGQQKFNQVNQKFGNESLERLVKNSNDLEKLAFNTDEIVQKSNPIFRNTESLGFLEAPYYAAHKNLLGVQISTFWANLLVIWAFSILLYVFLYFDWFKKMLRFRFKKA